MAQLSDIPILENGPKSLFYQSCFVTQDEADDLMDQIYAPANRKKWTQLRNRRLQNWGGIPSINGMIGEPLPEWLRVFTRNLKEMGIFDVEPNHVLINEYLPGQGIMPHEDGPAFSPTIATISLNSHSILNYYAKPSKDCKESITPHSDVNTTSCSPSAFGISTLPEYSILLESRSLIIVKHDMYLNYLHGIDELVEDRISLESVSGRDNEEEKDSNANDYKTTVDSTDTNESDTNCKENKHTNNDSNENDNNDNDNNSNRIEKNKLNPVRHLLNIDYINLNQGDTENTQFKGDQLKEFTGNTSTTKVLKRGKRISITIRVVPKVMNNNLKSSLLSKLSKR